MIDNAYPESAKLPHSAIGRSARHVFLCIGPDCCDPDIGQVAWEFLKSATARLGVPVMRSKAACLRICQGGPWMVVYPDGIWYGGMTPDRIQRVLDTHVAGGEPVHDWVVAATGAACGKFPTYSSRDPRSETCIPPV